MPHALRRLQLGRAGVLATDDGYVYQWTSEQDAVEVWPQHVPQLLTVEGMTDEGPGQALAPVSPVRELVLPEPATVMPTLSNEGDQDLSHLELPAASPDGPPAIEPATVPAAAEAQTAPAAVRISHRWSDADKARASAERPELA
jgi:hypothetical protein